MKSTDSEEISANNESVFIGVHLWLIGIPLISFEATFMKCRNKSTSVETRDILRALRRAAQKALEIGIQTGTPVYVMKNGEILDLTKDKAATKKIRLKLIKKLKAGL